MAFFRNALILLSSAHTITVAAGPIGITSATSHYETRASNQISAQDKIFYHEKQSQNLRNSLVEPGGYNALAPYSVSPPLPAVNPKQPSYDANIIPGRDSLAQINQNIQPSNAVQPS